MNNKGFAITTVVYSILILLALFMFIILGNLRNEYNNQKEFTSGINEELNNYLNPDIELPPSCNIEITGSGVERLLTIKTSAVSLDSNPYSWISETEGFSKTNTKTVSANGIYTGYVKSSTGLVGNCSCEVNNIIINSDTSGANEPALATGLIPVYYDGTVWRKADSRNGAGAYRWYSYSSSGSLKGMWANAVTVDVSTATIKDKYFNSDMSIKVTNGTEISMSDINTMWVWIPRFNVDMGGLTTKAYFSSIRGPATAGDEYLTPGAINVNFVNTSTAAHDAFTFDGEKAGFWYGKFETSSDIECTYTNIYYDAPLGEGCNLTTIKPKIIPNTLSWTGAQVATYFNASRNMEAVNNMYGFVGSEIDTHLSKNNEWGAVAYLTQSIYGRCSNATTCSGVEQNDGVGDITGSGDYATKINQSTTGTIYGIYDMNGGVWEFVMGNYNYISGLSTSSTGNSGFSGLNNDGSWTTAMPFPESKYVNIYTGTHNDGYDTFYGHALTETKGWYDEHHVTSHFTSSPKSWFYRGNSSGAYNGMFYYGGFNGAGRINVFGSRFTLIK